MRKFATIKGFEHITLPMRKTAKSAGYDLTCAKDTVCPAATVTLIPTGLKAYMPDDEYLAIFVRSSIAVKRSLMLANGVGVIDADYADNVDNEGHIMIPIYNASGKMQTISAGERIAQGIFTKYGVTEDDSAIGERTGGFGSTDEISD